MHKAISTLVVVGRTFVASEDLDGGEAFDIVGTANGLVLRHIDGTNLHEPLECRRCLGVLGHETLAVAAPWRVELDHPDRVVVDDARLEVCFRQLDDGRRAVVQGAGRRRQRCNECACIH